MKRIFNIAIIIVISNYSLFCYSNEPVIVDNYFLYSTEEITGVITKQGIEFDFFSAPRYDPKNRTITGSSKNTGVMTFHLDDLQWIKVKKFDTGKTVLASILIPAGVVGGTFALVALLKESCPFVYSFDGNVYTFDAEPYGGAITESLRKTDYSRLEYLEEVDGEYILMMRNEVEETQYTDEMKILVIDHDRDKMLYPDEQGNFYLVDKLIKPIGVNNRTGKDVSKLFNDRDDNLWVDIYSNINHDRQSNLRDTLSFEFERSEITDSTLLIVNAGTALWGSHMIRSMLELRGDSVESWYSSVDNQEYELLELVNFIEREELYILKVWVKVGGKWEVRGVISGGGLFVYEDRAIPLDLSGIDGDIVSIQLRPPIGFWAIDQVNLTSGKIQMASTKEIGPISAINDKGEELRSIISKIDRNYYIMPEVGNWLKLRFSAIDEEPVGLRSLYLKTTGYYRLHLPEGRTEQTELISQMHREQGAILRYSYNEYREWKMNIMVNRETEQIDK